MKKNTTPIETDLTPSEVSIDNGLKEKKFTEENSAAIKNKMDTARTFMKEHGLANVSKLRTVSTK